MSEYIDAETEFKDKDCLIDSLVGLGIKKANIEVHDSPVNLKGYKNDTRTQKCHIVIRKVNVGSASNDIGFERTAEGTYKAYVSEYDSGHGLGKDILTGKLKQQYSKAIVLKQVQKTHGQKVTLCEDKNGKIRIRISAK